MIYICNFHVLSNLLLIYICKLHWNLISSDGIQESLIPYIDEDDIINDFWMDFEEFITLFKLVDIVFNNPNSSSG